MCRYVGSRKGGRESRETTELRDGRVREYEAPGSQYTPDLGRRAGRQASTTHWAAGKGKTWFDEEPWREDRRDKLRAGLGSWDVWESPRRVPTPKAILIGSRLFGSFQPGSRRMRAKQNEAQQSQGLRGSSGP